LKKCSAKDTEAIKALKRRLRDEEKEGGGQHWPSKMHISSPPRTHSDIVEESARGTNQHIVCTVNVGDIVFTHTHTHTHTYIYIYIYIYIYTYIYIYIYIYSATFLVLILVNLIQLDPNWVTSFKLVTLHYTIGIFVLRGVLVNLRGPFLSLITCLIRTLK